MGWVDLASEFSLYFETRGGGGGGGGGTFCLIPYFCTLNV